ncbi:tripartite tricarboxylate transporter substrate binding protein [Siccirubricoccus sp. KC 17139]|uniref:Tripartite tricarboxylate transporter substrate binding protein n=1 Tax=Siccirubricoccus soli TaxID=2899147 RepID=A0ABT1D6P4_9PROT|nr:tripartite tricarboxylate transporter substrate binding protein [Siccirubricoccus soli]MCO6417257.1 tripartite tricarboxylate transporter substrate binding protein [Siccirubricoccus soli]MCP2683392.1 tripartite tricarboxylate transporter substrate binding protein [Siccirubricoccus soli]
MPYRRLLLTAAGLTLATPPLHCALAQTPGAWPSRPIRIIVPFGLGGSADVAARFLAEPLSQALGQPVVVENWPGGGAVIGTDTVAKAPPDGHTLLLMSNTHTANETLIPARPYVLLRDLAPVAAINIAYHVLAAHPSLGVRSVAELVAKAKAAPGRIDFASSGPGTPYHIAGEVFRAMAGIEINHIPFRGSNEARTALIAGQVPMMFDAIPTMREQITGGRVLGLATTGPARSPLLADLPTVADTVPGYEASIWLGLMAPAGLPAPIRDRLHAEVTKLLTTPASAEAMARGGAQPMPMTLAEFGAFLERDIERQRAWIHMAGLLPG